MPGQLARHKRKSKTKDLRGPDQALCWLENLGKKYGVSYL
jgi:hypothetical protein